MKLGTIEIPDCVAVPQPWWESSGVTVAVFFLVLALIVGITFCVLNHQDRKAGMK